MEGSSTGHQLGKYRLVATLGQGGMGTVYLALASGLGQFRKLLVVKELRQDLTRQAGFVSMFMDEAKLAARLDHPNVVQTFEASQEDERYFLAMEYLDGQPLSALIERLQASKGLPLWVHIQILCEALSGLQYAHELPDYDGSLLHVVHRDVSPQNVFLTYHGQVKVVDFGVAKAADASSMTDPGVFKGKFAYAAPEQVLGRPVDARTDLFAIGVMLWEAIAGQRFSEQLATPAAFRARAAGKERKILEVVPGCDPLLAEICDRAMATDPEQRFASAEEFRSELQEYLMLSGVRVEAPEIGQFMRDVFDKERREIHLLIEKAMKHSGASDSSVEALPFMAQDDQSEATMVADLSSLVDVSYERDDDKIRRGYAHSKITMLRQPNSQAPQVEFTASGAPPAATSNRWMMASMGLSVSCLVVLLVVLFVQRGPSADADAPSVVQLPAAAAPAPAMVMRVKPPQPPEPEVAAPADPQTLGDEANSGSADATKNPRAGFAVRRPRGRATGPQTET
ncbi:MAG TPA: serine/threonine-protein kinase, partial [Polyangiales bacterium]|nr:serine/threonine-protein kinase [Polyangiales bacterium]